MAERGIVVSAILLVDKDAGILVHPDYNTAGIYSMANMTDPRVATDAYRAIVALSSPSATAAPISEHGWITPLDCLQRGRLRLDLDKHGRNADGTLHGCLQQSHASNLARNAPLQPPPPRSLFH